MQRNTIWFLRMGMAVTVLFLAFYLFLDARDTDNEAPVISIDDEVISVSVSDPESCLLQGITVWDNRDGDITDSLIIESIYGITEDGCATVTFAAVDHSGNVTKTERVVHYTDYTSPVFTLSEPLVFEFGSYFDVLDCVGAYDIFDGDISRRIKPTMLSSGTSVAEEGNHEVQFRVTNSMGDTSQLVLPVEVYPVGAYNAQVVLTDYLVYLPAGTDFEATRYLLQLQTQGDIFDLREGISDSYELNISGEVDTGTPGVYPVAYTVSHWHNGIIYTGYTKLLVVVEAREAA